MPAAPPSLAEQQMIPVRILGVGTAAPTLRLPAAEINAAWGRSGGRGHTAVCNPDEDTLTLAWDAATAAITAAGVDASAVDGLWWGTSHPPFADGPNHAVLSNALSLPASAGGALCSGSQHSGIEALLSASDAIAAGSARVAVVVVSDALRPGPGTGFESRAGAGAAAIVLAAEGGSAALVGRVTRSQPHLDRYRGDGELDQRDLYDGRLFREVTFLPLMRDLARELLSVGARSWSIPDPDGRLGAAVAKEFDVTNEGSAAAYAALGDTGAAAALLGVLLTFNDLGTRVAIGYGGGRATGVVFEVETLVPGASDIAATISGGRVCSYAKALRARAQLTPGGETIPMGVPPESALFARGAQEMLQLLGGRCVDCGTISTPPSIHPHCISCGGPKLEPVQLARSGTVHTFVVNHTMPAPFEAPLPIAVIDLDDGARIMLQVADNDNGLEIGSRMRLVLRKYAHERGAPVYGFKAIPIAPGPIAPDPMAPGPITPEPRASRPT
jgi:hydroxymethylglutaryl-CoA synthase